MTLTERIRSVPPELRNAGIAAVVLVVSMLLPWYQKSYFAVSAGHAQPVQVNLNAFDAFSFVEAAVLLVAAAILFLVWARSDRRAFHLPGGDGAMITAAGAWTFVLLIWRLFDKPDVNGPATMGIQWGIFGAMLAAGAIIAAGVRVRSAHRPEPPNPAADDFDFTRPPLAGARRPDRRPRDPAAVTEVLRDRPAWEGEPPAAPRVRAADTAPTEHLDNDALTERLPRDDESLTERLPRDDESLTERLPRDRHESRTERLPREYVSPTDRLEDRYESPTDRLPDGDRAARRRRRAGRRSDGTGEPPSPDRLF